MCKTRNFVALSNDFSNFHVLFDVGMVLGERKKNRLQVPEKSLRRQIGTVRTDICIQYANKAILMVSGRDYVSVRAKREIDGVFFTSGYSIEDLPEMPPLDGRTRGVLHVNGGRFRQDPTDPRSTLVDNILCLDVRGMIPKSLVNSVSTLNSDRMSPDLRFSSSRSN